MGQMKQLLRFAMLTAFYPPYNFGGDGIYVHRLANELACRGHQVHVIHCRDAYRALAHSDPPGTYHDHPNVTVHGLESRWGLLSPLLTHQTGLPLLKAAQIQRILQQGFNVIHYHTVSHVGGPGVLRYGQGIKLYSTHDHWLVCPTRELFRFNRAICTQRLCLLCSLTHGRPPQLWRYTALLQAGLKHIDAFTVGSRFSMRKHRELGIGGRFFYLPFFVPSQESTADPPSPSLQPPDGPYFFCVGRLTKAKGLHTLMPVFRHWNKAPLLVAGSGCYEHRLRQLAAGNDNVRFLGQVPRSQLPQLYRQAVAVIVPSIGYEIAPLVIVEAFRERTPVLARNLGGLSEPVADSGAGFIYDTDQQLVAAMDRLIENPSLRRELGQRAYRAYRSKWTPDAHLQRYFALIDQIAAAKASGALAPR